MRPAHLPRDWGYRWYKMVQANTTHIYECISKSIGNFIVTISLFALPFHILMIKVLISDLHLNLPRYKILLCLSISDAMQIFVTSFCVTIARVFSLTTGSSLCHISRKILLFNISVTITISSLATAGLSLERYVACIHSFRLHYMFTRKRILFCTLCGLLIGIAFGSTTITVKDITRQQFVVDDNQAMKILAVVVVLPTTILISAVQYRLFVFSRKMLATVGPGTIHGRKTEAADYRWRQIKVTFVASIVAITYMVCMFPLSCLSIHELVSCSNSYSLVHYTVRVLAVANNFINPYVYGFGIADLRKALLKKVKSSINACSKQS